MALAAVLGLLSLTVYLRTLAPGLTFGDSGDLSLAALQLGVPHPTGYPLYTLIGHGFMRLWPAREPAWSMNALSALCAGTAVALLYIVAVHVLATRWAAALAAATFAVTPSFWSQALVTEVYALHILLLVALMLLVLRWSESPTRTRACWAALLFGLMCTHHLMSVWVAPGMALFVLMRLGRRPRLRATLTTLICAALPLLMYAYLPWAALRDPAWNWGDPRTPARFAAHISGRLYRERMGDAETRSLRHRVLRYVGVGQGDAPEAVPAQYPMVLLLAAPFGLLAFLHRQRAIGLWLLLLYALPLAWALTYRIRDIEPYFLPSHLIVALWIGAGIARLARALGRVLPFSRRARTVAGRALALVVPGMMAMTAYASMDRSSDHGADHVASAVLDAVKTDAILVLSGDAWGFPVVYHHYALRKRPDVAVLLYLDFLVSGHRRLVERERARGIAMPQVPAPDSYHDDELVFLKAFLDANRRARPCYVVGDAFGAAKPGDPVARAMGRARRVAPGLPVFELVGPNP